MTNFRNLTTITFFIMALLMWGCTNSTSPSVPESATTQPDDAVTATDEGGNDAASVDNEAEATDESAAEKESVGDISTAADKPVRILVENEVRTLDPYLMVNTHPEGSIASHIWDTLTVLNANLQVEPHLAESWRIVNNVTWEVKLRPGIKFHNGEPVDSRAVAFSVERSMNLPNTTETFAADVALDTVNIIDDYTIEFVTREPIVNFPYHLAFLEILPPTYYAETDPVQLGSAPIGSGPYQLAENTWRSGNAVTLLAFDDYWQGRPVTPQITFETVASSNERLRQLQSGEAQLITDLPPMRPEQWGAQGSRLEAIESSQKMFIGIRAEEGSPLDDNRVRQALNHAVDVDHITDLLLEGYGEKYGSWVYALADEAPDAWGYDPDLARQLLTEAGFADGFTTTLRTPSGFYYRDVDIATEIARQLQEVGVHVEVSKETNSSIYMRELLQDNTAPLFLLGLNSFGDPMEDAMSLVPGYPYNPIHWQSTEYTNLISSAETNFNESSRLRLLQQAQSIAYEQAPIIGLWKMYDFYGVDNTLDWTPRPDGLVNLYKPAENSEDVE
ncbi:MAG: hypothetical protein KDJ52_15935 [Anaerolineae bacterium]|nr:hypothetical protein [Anaerolineae bacterium]